MIHLPHPNGDSINQPNGAKTSAKGENTDPSGSEAHSQVFFTYYFFLVALPSSSWKHQHHPRPTPEASSLIAEEGTSPDDVIL